MKRSLINEIIREAEEFSRACRFHLPPFAYWSIEEWQHRVQDVAQIVERGLGWDITDFGLGNFQEHGLTLFTIRNGRPDNLRSGQGEVYAEKILVVHVEQVTPLHFHWLKTEDIINRGGGRLAVKLYNATASDKLDSSDVLVRVDSILRRVPAGGIVTLQPGESITLTPRLYHAFWAKGERVFVGEVSSVNDDAADNRFYEAVGRFPDIEEDVQPARLLVNDYKNFLPAIQ
jgi:D-lyxose ketol-isomerase